VIVCLTLYGIHVGGLDWRSCVTGTGMERWSGKDGLKYVSWVWQR
jgi:hypothetical protein